MARGGEWLLQSPLHVAAYSGDKERLIEILGDCKIAIAKLIVCTIISRVV